VLQQTFAKFGEISFCRVCVDMDTNQSRGFGFVCFTTQQAAESAAEELNGTEMDGKVMEVKQVSL
jgi:RNA recognition motif-containing protein